MYGTDLKGLEFDETGSARVQVFPYGEYKHPRYGPVSMTRTKAETLQRNFADRVIPADIPINYGHKAEGAAAGWYKQLHVEEDGLYADVGWTQSAIDKISDGEYRYFSAELDPEWVNPKTQERHKDVLRGGALTNVPFFKEISAVQLSEEKGTSMKFADELAATLELSEGATEEDILATVKGLKHVRGLKEAPPSVEEAPKEPTPQSYSDQIKDELERAGLPQVFSILEAKDERIAKLELADRMREAQVYTDRWMSAQFSLPSSVSEGVQSLLLSLPPENKNKLIEVFDELSKVGYLSQEVGSSGPRGEGGSPTLQFAELVDKYAKEQKLDYADAVEFASNEHPDMFEAYQRATTNWTAVPADTMVGG